MTDIEIGQKMADREILTMIEKICFSKEYFEYRVNYGSNGQRDLIINSIRKLYGV